MIEEFDKVEFDKNLLILAAKAAGIDGQWGCEGFIEQHEGFIPTGWRRSWNPLEDDGDAFRLAAKLGLGISIVLGSRRTDVVSFSDSSVSNVQIHVPDVLTATRRAIVQVAAEIGEKMK